jgi:hypothetical protein
LRKRKDAGARINDDQLVVVSANLNAGGVAAIANGRGSRRRYGASYTPKFNFHLAP